MFRVTRTPIFDGDKYLGMRSEGVVALGVRFVLDALPVPHDHVRTGIEFRPDGTFSITDHSRNRWCQPQQKG